MTQTGSGPLVGIVLGSPNDLETMKKAADTLREFGVPFEMTVASAHRSPERAAEYARGAASRGLRVIIAGAGMAAHLGGVLAAHTILPVIGVPLSGSALLGMDALLSTVQMPPGVPVAAVGVDAAANAALLAVQMLSVADETLRARLEEHKRKLARAVEEKAADVERAAGGD